MRGRGARRRGPRGGRGQTGAAGRPCARPSAAALPATPGAQRGRGGGSARGGVAGAPRPPVFYRLIFQIVPAGSGAASPLPAAPPRGQRLPREPGS